MDYSYAPKVVAQIKELENKLIGDKVLPPLVLNIGGEGQPWEPQDAININVLSLRPAEGGKKPIPNFFARLDFDADFEPIPDKCADRIVLISVPLTGGKKGGLKETSDEAARLIKPGGTIVIENPDTDTARNIAKAFIDAVGSSGTSKQEIVVVDKVMVLRTTITIKPIDKK